MTAFSEQLELAGHQRQLHIRSCNLFAMTTNEREKVELNEQTVASSSYNTYDLSPNAALRPLYQEWVLPNVLYVAGPSELKYWLQLKGLFDNYAMPMPILHLRTSNIVMPKKIAENYDILDFELFATDETVAAHYDVKIANLSEDFESLHTALIDKLNGYERLAADTFPGFNLSGKISKIVPKLNELNSLAKEQLIKKSKENIELSKMLKVKALYFNKMRFKSATSTL